MASRNAIPVFYWSENDIEIKTGTRVRVVSREGTKGTGTVKEILYWSNCPATITVEMDDDTEYSNRRRPGWPLDMERIPTTGLYGGEIREILTLQ